ncbi:ribonuclease Y, partial [Candidatus Berkelbacteria bacterium]|nr:ribonuclease Y [Candidatus Berkelbacteria bacterium]
EEAKGEVERGRKEVKDLEDRVRSREEQVVQRVSELDDERKRLLERERELDQIRTELTDLKDREVTELEKVAKLKKDDAKDLLLKQVERDFKDDLVRQYKKIRDEVKADAETQSRMILATAVQRLAAEHTTESTTAVVQLPSEDMKGRIIGKEGRNIQAFERATGVDVIIDDSPDTVTLSCFDAVRRHVAKTALEKLLSDGRIQPARIEEVVQKAEQEVTKEMEKAAELAMQELGITGFHQDLARILGRLKFRTSYGQNVLQHSMEVAQAAGMLAAELGANVDICKKAGLLHDVGKALDAEVPGAHHHISMDIARKYGFSEHVINAIGAHHDDIDPKSVEAIIVRAADAISASRPGARRETLENYIKRVKELENLALSFPGIEKAYAIQAGREVRILVKPDTVDDLGALKLSRDIARKIEQDLQFPGMIKVNVIRETRAVEYAK